MEKKGFWNFLGLTSRKNLLELEETISKMNENNILRQKYIYACILETSKEQRNCIENISGKIEELNIKVENIKADLKEMKELQQGTDDRIRCAERNLNTVMEEKMQDVSDKIYEYNGFLKKTDLNMKAVLDEYTKLLNDIADRMANMDCVVNLEKIESLLKMIAVYNMMGEMDADGNR